MQSATFLSVAITDLLECYPDEVADIFRDVSCLLDEEKISPISQTTSYNYGKSLECFETLRTGNMGGKAILSAQRDVVPVCQLIWYLLSPIDMRHRSYAQPRSRSYTIQILLTYY